MKVKHNIYDVFIVFYFGLVSKNLSAKENEI